MPEIGKNSGFVDRGDPEGWDFSLTDLIVDSEWHPLALLSIVPPNARAALIRLLAISTNVNDRIYLRRYGNVNYINVSHTFSQVAGGTLLKDCIVPLPSDRKIEYIVIGTGFTSLTMAVGGWWT